MTCSRCGRQRSADELVQLTDGLVCEPCADALVKAEQRRDSIDDAWRAVEAVLPKTHRISGLGWADEDEDWYALVEPIGEDPNTFNTVSAHAPTPVLALRRLAEIVTDFRTFTEAT